MKPADIIPASAYTSHLKQTTAKNAAYHLRAYLSFVYSTDVSLEELDAVSIQHISDVFAGSVSAFRKFREYCEMLKQTPTAPTTIKTRISSVKRWYSWNNISFSGQEQAILSTVLPRAVNVSEDEDITAEQIRSILHHSDVLLKALILLAVSSGARINEILQLRYSDLVDGTPKAFRIPRERMKAGRAHTYFYSEEAGCALDEWNKRRPEYVRRAKVKIELCLKQKADETSGELIFPICYNTARERLRRTLKAAELWRVDDAGRDTIHFHSFRKFCDSEMKRHIPTNTANALIGHYEAGDISYRRYSKEILREEYLKCEPYLTILAPKEYAELQTTTSRRITETNATMSALAARLVETEREYAALRELILSMSGSCHK